MEKITNIELDKIKEADEKINFLLKTLDTAADGIYWMNKEGQFVYVNDLGCEILGYDKDELLRLTIFDVNPHATIEKWNDTWDKIIETGLLNTESIHKRKDGTEFPVEISSSFVRIENSEFINGFARDISERKKAEKIIKEKMEELEKINKIMVSRELDMIKLKEKLNETNL